MKYLIAVTIRISNIILNVGTGIILAQTLSVHDRGEVAIIFSVISLAITVYSAVYSERMLKNKKPNGDRRSEEIEFNLIRLFILCAFSIFLIQNAIENESIFIIILSLVLIIFGNLNTLFNSAAHKTDSLIVNQIFLFCLTLIYFVFLLLNSQLLVSTVTSWIVILSLSNVCIFVAFIIYFKVNDVEINVRKKIKMTKISISAKPKYEGLAVFSAIMSQQILIIGLSQFSTTHYVAKMTVLLSLFSIVNIPLMPVLPSLISNANNYLDQLMALRTGKMLKNLIFVSSYGFLMSLILKSLFPYMYGSKYAQLSESVPLVVFAAIGFSVSQLLSWICRGMEMFIVSAFLNLTPLVIILIAFTFSSYSINSLFSFMAFMYYFVDLNVYLLMKRKVSK